MATICNKETSWKKELQWSTSILTKTMELLKTRLYKTRNKRQTHPIHIWFLGRNACLVFGECMSFRVMVINATYKQYFSYIVVVSFIGGGNSNQSIIFLLY
jgi:hypothetical protein